MNHAITIRLSAAGTPVVPNTTWTKEPSTTILVARSLYNCEMTASNRILIRKAGKYLICAYASLTIGTVGGVIQAAISKNGAAPTATAIAQGSSLTSILGVDIVYARLFDQSVVNDYYELFVNAAAATTSIVGAKYTLEAYLLSS